MPSVVSTSPQNGAIEIYINTSITATFDSSMNPAFINTSTFVVYNASLELVPAAVTYDSTTNTATFIPTEPLLTRALYTVVLVGGANGIQTLPDGSGNIAYLSNYSWTFTTNDGRFSVPPIAQVPSGVPSGIIYPTGVNYYTQFAVVSSQPANRATQLPISGIYTNINGFPTITVCFNKPVDPASLNATGLYCMTQAPLIVMNDVLQDPWGPNNVNLSNSGTWSAVLWQATFTFNSPSYFNNNEQISVTIPSNIASTDGTLLGTPYTFYFTTQYSPLYAGPLRVRADLGNLIADVPDDTIYRLLYHNSLIANYFGSVNQQFGGYVNDIRPFVTTRVTGFEAIVLRPSFPINQITGQPPLYVTEFVSAKTELDLIKARYFGLMDSLFLAGGPGASKMLADLRVSEGGGSLWAATLGPLLEKLEGNNKAALGNGSIDDMGSVRYWLNWIVGKHKWTDQLRAQWGRYAAIGNPRRTAFLDNIGDGDYFRIGAGHFYTGMMGGGYGPLPPVDPNRMFM